MTRGDDEHARHADSVGAYLLGALDGVETEAFERHLAGCVSCADELDRLRVAADALPRSVEPLSPPPELKRALMRSVRAEARQSPAPSVARHRTLAERLGWGLGMRPSLATAAIGTVLLVAVAVGFGASRLGGSASNGRVLSAEIDHSRAPRATATLAVSSGGGSVLRVNGLPSPGAGEVYEVWLKRGASVVPASLFSVGADGHGAAGIAAGLKGVDVVMVTREVAAGAAQPTQAPLISVKT